jgi:hypothetical protein
VAKNPSKSSMVTRSTSARWVETCFLIVSLSALALLASLSRYSDGARPPITRFGAGCQRGLVHDRVVHGRLDFLLLTLGLREDVMDVDGLVEIEVHVRCFPGAPVDSALFEQEGV